MKLNIKLLSKRARLPQKAHATDAAYDLYIPDDELICSNERTVISLGFAIELPEGYCAEIVPRSGFSSRGMEGYKAIETYGLDIKIEKPLIPRRFNADVLYGLIDHGYRGSIGVIIKNHDHHSFLLKAGTRIAQMIIRKVENVDFCIVDSLSESDRQESGFGDSGIF